MIGAVVLIGFDLDPLTPRSGWLRHLLVGNPVVLAGADRAAMAKAGVAIVNSRSP